MKKCLLFFSILLISGCSHSEQSNQVPEVDEILLRTKQQFFKEADFNKKKLTHTKSVFLAEKLNNGTNPEAGDGLILFTRITDCSSCIKKGLDFFNNPDFNKINKVVLINGDPNLTVNPISFSNKLYDMNDSVQSIFGYFHTPVVIDYNIKSGIRDMYFIPTFDDEDGLEEFIGRLDVEH